DPRLRGPRGRRRPWHPGRRQDAAAGRCPAPTPLAAEEPPGGHRAVPSRESGRPGVRAPACTGPRRTTAPRRAAAGGAEGRAHGGAARDRYVAGGLPGPDAALDVRAAVREAGPGSGRHIVNVAPGEETR